MEVKFCPGFTKLVGLSAILTFLKFKRNTFSCFKAFGQYNLNDRLQAGLTQRAHYGSGGASLTWAVRQDLSVVLSYSRLEQSLQTINDNPWIDRNRATVSINYSFTRPIGR